jgi:SAM-dependent methyltransferase
MTAILTDAFTLADWPTETVACNLCGGTATEVVATVDRYQWPVTTVRCLTCGLRYLNPRMTKEGYAAFYRDGYRPLFASLSKVPHSLAMLEHDQRQYCAHLLPQLLSWLPMDRETRVLDIGGSTGLVGRTIAKARGYTSRVWVLDPSPSELARAEGCSTICGSVEDIPELPSADVALLCRTVEHLLDPAATLRKIAAACSRLVIDAMHVDGWATGWQYKVDHPYSFTADTLQALLERDGWRIDHQWWRRGQQYIGYLCTRKD